MKTPLLTMLLLAFCLSASTSYAQDWSYSMPQMPNYDQQMQAFQQQHQQNLARLEQKVAAAHRNIIAKYRKRTGDNQSPDHVCYQRQMQLYYQQNPQALQREQNQRQQRQQAAQQAAQRSQMLRQRDNAGWAATQQIIQNSNNSISDGQMRQFQYRMNSNDRSQNNWNNMMSERENVVNPQTGQLFNIESAPNRVQTFNSFDNPVITDSNGRHHQHNGIGWDELEKIR